jgi:hypothetical protein
MSVIIRWKNMNLEREWVKAEYDRTNPRCAVMHEMVPVPKTPDGFWSSSSVMTMTYTTPPQIEWIRKSELDKRNAACML